MADAINPTRNELISGISLLTVVIPEYHMHVAGQ